MLDNCEDKKKYCVDNIALLNYMDLRNLAISLISKGINFKQTGDTSYVNIHTMSDELIDYVKTYIDNKLFTSI